MQQANGAAQNNQGKVFSTQRVARVTRQAFLLSGMIGLGKGALSQVPTGMPDAQVESNVLKALAGAPELASEPITTRTMYGTVTLTGSVRDEALRTKAETLAANADGVKKVVDELQLGSGDASQQSSKETPGTQLDVSQAATPMVLQSDGTYAPASSASAVPEGSLTPGSAPAAQAQRNNPEADQALDVQMQTNNRDPNGTPQVGQNQAGQLPSGQQTYPDGTYGRRPMNGQGYPYPSNGYPSSTQGGYSPNGYPQGAPSPYPQSNTAPGYPQNGYPQNGYPQNGSAYGAQPSGQQPVWGGQTAGQTVIVPSGAMIRVRVNRTLASNHAQPGTVFDGIVTNDVVADGFVAIPRGASVQGRVIDAKSSGVLKGRGELSIQLTQVTLGGKTYAITSDVWAHNGGDKTIETINKTAGFGAVGAVFGALAGGGVGAAVGGGIGAAAGLGSSAASGNGQVIIPAEGMVTFHLAQDAPVQTVSEQEMQRLAYGVAPGADQPYARRPYPRGFYAPAPSGYPSY